MDPDFNDEPGPDESADAAPTIRELRAEMIRLQAQIDQIAAAAHDRADEVAILRGRLVQLERQIEFLCTRYRRTLRLLVAVALFYGVAVGLVLSYLLWP